MKYYTCIISILFFLTVELSTPYETEAKLLPRFQSASNTSSAPAISTRSYNGVIVSPSFMPGKSGLQIGFGNLQYAHSVTYQLTYETNGKQEGVRGTVDNSSGNSTSRNLQFGTCSSGTCVQHMRIKNMRLEVTSDLTSGKTSIKRYRITI